MKKYYILTVTLCILAIAGCSDNGTQPSVTQTLMPLKVGNTYTYALMENGKENWRATYSLINSSPRWLLQNIITGDNLFAFEEDGMKLMQYRDNLSGDKFDQNSPDFIKDGLYAYITRYSDATIQYIYYFRIGVGIEKREYYGSEEKPLFTLQLISYDIH